MLLVLTEETDSLFALSMREPEREKHDECKVDDALDKNRSASDVLHSDSIDLHPLR